MDVHETLGGTVRLFTLALGLWGLYSFVRKQSIGPNYWGALVVGELAIITQGLIGVVLLASSHEPRSFVHILYGVVAIITWPAAFAYTRGRDTQSEAFTYGLVGLFLFGITLRASGTG